MYINFNYIREAVSQLEYIHPFYGLTFLVCKRADLPIGDVTTFPIENLETEFLEEYFQPFPDSEYFFRLFRISDKLKLWVHQTKYASSTLQSIRTRSTFSTAFIHERGSALWGWESDYAGVLRANLKHNLKQYKNNKIPVFLLTCWLYRDQKWSSNSTSRDLIQRFLHEFKIRADEHALFDLETEDKLFQIPLFQAHHYSLEEMKELIGPPPDAEPEKGETLSLLELQDVGPMSHMHFEPARRLNLLTGDNGLGKTFVLECSWWALTGQWRSIQSQASPKFSKEAKPVISFQIAGEQSKLEKVVSRYDLTTQRWSERNNRPTIQGLAIYARVDGSFAVWNPVRQSILREADTPVRNSLSLGNDLKISSDQVWNGIDGQFEGLMRDWLEWQNSSEINSGVEGPFEIFKRVLALLSPPDLGVLEPGEPVRLAFESKRIPTLKHKYGEVPIIYESAAVRRILALSYLIVWTWNEHLVYSELSKTPIQRRMVVLIDEIEAHLHPLWQRRVLPALLDVSNELSGELQTQFFIATHSPLVMASAESLFNDRTDGLFHIDLTQEGEVKFGEIDFVRQGSVDAWLTSNVFDLRHARSYAAEEAIERAKAIQLQKEPSKDDIRNATTVLLATLAADDGFWSRWNYFAEKHGIEL